MTTSSGRGFLLPNENPRRKQRDIYFTKQKLSRDKPRGI